MLKTISLLYLLCVVCLALPALAAEKQVGATHCASYSITVNQYFNGEEIGVTEFGLIPDSPSLGACQICAPSEPGGIPACFLLVLPPQAWSGTPWPQIKANLQGHILPPLREAVLHGVRIYYYYPYANDVRFTLSARDAGDADARWVETVTIAQ